MTTELDPAAVVREHAAFVWRVLRYQGVPEAELEDVSQEVFLVIVRSLGRFEGRATLQTWIYGVCRNVALHARRSHARNRESASDTLPEVGSAETQSQDLARLRMLDALRAALAALAEPTRMTFVLFEIEQLAMHDVSKAVGCAVSTSYSRLYAAREHVKRTLEAGGHLDAYRELAEAL